MKKSLLLAILLFVGCIGVYAQTLQIRGRVFEDSTTSGLPNVSVVVSDTKKGVSTDNSGNFSLSIPGKTSVNLIISFVGYVSQTIKTNGGSPLTVYLRKSQVAVADEVVVIGYQSVRRRDLTSSVSSVSARDLKDIPINSAAEALNGRLAGVTATTAEGSPDAQIRIRVRGGMSITGDNSPLYIIDGVQVENGLSTISPQNIQTIDVLKDAAATAIYGARGANGVIVITTKSGRVGKLTVSYNGYIGFKTLPKTLKVLSPYDYVIFQSERSRRAYLSQSSDSSNFIKNFGVWDTLANYTGVTPINWQNEVFGNTGITQTHNVTASGGSKKITYNFGYTYNDDKAIVLNSNYKRHLLNLKSDYRVTNNLRAGISTRYTIQNVYGAGVSSDQGAQYNRLRNAVKYRPFKADSTSIEDIDPLADPNVGNSLSLINPIALASSEYRKKTTENYNVTVNASYTITKNLTFRSTFGYDWNKFIDRQFSDTLTTYSVVQGSKKPIAGLDTTERKTITNSNVLTYSVKGFKNRHDFDFLIGEETYDLRTESHSGLFKNYPSFTSPDNAFKSTDIATPFAGYPTVNKTRYTSLSFFGRINYAYLDKYLLSLNVRRDGASKFAENQRWGTFPAGSIAWRVKKENFLKDVSFIDDMKLRFGYGEIGNNRINDYLYLSTFSSNGSRYYGLNNQTVIAYYPVSLPNENLKWESTVNRNFGIDITLLKNKIDFSVDVYNNSSKDLLLNVPIDPSYGFATQLQNIGKTSNKGVEFQLNAVIIRKPKNFSWTANFNISTNKNKIVELGLGQQSFFPASSWFSANPTDYIARIGDPVGSMWGLVSDGFYKVNDFDYTTSTGKYTLKAGVVNDTAVIGGPVQPGSMKYKDLDGDGYVDLNKDRTIIGNPTPKFTGGLNQQFTYKRWDMSVFVNFSYGNDIYNANKIELSNGYTNNGNLLDIMKNRWRITTPTGQSSQWVLQNMTTKQNEVFGLPPDQLAALNANASIWMPLTGTGAFYPTSWAIEDGSFLRINNVTIGYTVPATAIKMSRLRFYVTANNLAVFTKYSGYDPEVSVRNSGLTPGLDYSAYPKSRSFIFGVNATF